MISLQNYLLFLPYLLPPGHPSLCRTPSVCLPCKERVISPLSPPPSAYSSSPRTFFVDTALVVSSYPPLPPKHRPTPPPTTMSTGCLLVISSASKSMSIGRLLVSPSTSKVSASPSPPHHEHWPCILRPSPPRGGDDQIHGWDRGRGRDSRHLRPCVAVSSVGASLLMNWCGPKESPIYMLLFLLHFLW